MAIRRFFGITLHLLLAVGLVLPGIAAPAQAAKQALAFASGTPDPRSQTSCAGMSMTDDAPATMPHGAQHGCDLAACLGSGCLPTLPHVAAFVPEADSP